MFEISLLWENFCKGMIDNRAKFSPYWVGIMERINSDRNNHSKPN